MGAVAAAALVSSDGALGVEWSHRVWPLREHGDGSVRAIAPLPSGGLAIGTDRGLARFDGHRFHTVDLAALGIDWPIVQHLHVDRSGRLHVVFRSGAHAVIDEKGLRLLHDEAAARRAALAAGLVDSMEPTGICEAADGAIWVGHRNGAAKRVVADRVDWFSTESSTTLETDAAIHLATDAGGTVWVARKGLLGAWDGSAWEPKAELPLGRLRIAASRSGGLWVLMDDALFRFDEAAGLRPCLADRIRTVKEMAEGPDGRLWLATTRYGLFVVEPAADHAGGEAGFTQRSVAVAGRSMLALSVDRDGMLWAGTTAGLNQVQEAVVHRSERPTQIPLRTLRCDTAGRLWFLTLSGAVGCESDGGEPVFVRADGRSGKFASLAAARDGGVWLGTLDGSVMRLDSPEDEGVRLPEFPAGSDEAAVKALLATRRGDLWAAAGSQLFCHRGNVWIPAQRSGAADTGGDSGDIKLLAEDAAGNVWCATDRGEILCVDALGDGARPVLSLQNPAGLPAEPRVTAICPLPDGSVWFAIPNNGLWRWRDARFTRIGVEHGLPSTALLALVADGQGRLWCVSGRRIFTALIDELEATAEGSRKWVHCWTVAGDGNEDIAFFDPRVVPPNNAILDASGRVLVILSTGIAVCEPARVPRPGPAPRVDLQEIRIDGRVVDAARSITIPPRPGIVELLFAERSLVKPSNARVQHRLEGIDAGWVDSPPQRAVSYARIPAGMHRFWLRSSTNHGRWEEPEAAVALTVEPFFWERPWFPAVALAAVAGLAAAAAAAWSSKRARERVAALRHLAELDRERMRIARDMHDEVGTNLTQISLLSELARGPTKADATAHLDEVARISRETAAAFDEIVWAINPVNDTLPHLLSYLTQRATQSLGRFGIACTIEVPDAAVLEPVLATADMRRNVLLIVKEAIGNVVKHAQARSVRLAMRVEGGRLAITVEDDGCGIASAATADQPGRPCSGLRNMAARAADIGGTCSVATPAGGGTAVRIEVPMQASSQPQRGSASRRAPARPITG